MRRWVFTVVLAGLGVLHISDDWSILRALSPHYGVLFLLDNGFLGFVILGSVFLATTKTSAEHVNATPSVLEGLVPLAG